MSVENLQKFYRFLDQHSEIRTQVNNLPDRASFVESMIRLGSENGFQFTSIELESAIAGIGVPMDESALSDAALNAVAGGARQASTRGGAVTQCGEFTKWADPFCT